MNAKTPRRWLSFSLRTMFIVVTAICCWLGWESSVVRGRQALRKEMQTRPSVNVITAELWAALYPPGGPARGRPASVSLVRGWLGDEAIQEIAYCTHYQPLSDAELKRLARTFPEARL